MKVYVRFSQGLVETNTVTYKGNGGLIKGTSLTEYSQTFGTTVDNASHYPGDQSAINRVNAIRSTVQVPVAGNVFERSGYEF